jgi:hypothetical protein
MNSRLIVASVATACIVLAAIDASAQGFPGGGRHGPGIGNDASSTRKPPAAEASKKQAAADPIAALERELPSLKADIHLTAAQVAAWSAFERDVRDAAEMGRISQRHVLSVQANETPPRAARLLNGLADDEKMRSDTLADVKRDFDALYALLDDKQKALLDDRVILALKEPLGG